MGSIRLTGAQDSYSSTIRMDELEPKLWSHQSTCLSSSCYFSCRQAKGTQHTLCVLQVLQDRAVCATTTVSHCQRSRTCLESSMM